MRITERFQRRDFGQMDLTTTFEDQKNYTRPFTVTVGLELIPDSDVQEYVCAKMSAAADISADRARDGRQSINYSWWTLENIPRGPSLAWRLSAIAY
jgi:hypothetical protein